MGQLRREHFDSHGALEFTIEPLKHYPHAPVPDDLQHVVSAQTTKDVWIISRLQVFNGKIDFGPGIASKCDCV